MKGNRGRRERLPKADDLEMLGRGSRRSEFGRNLEPEPVIVAMVPDQDTSFGALLAEDPETGLDELATHAPPLKDRLDRHGTEGEPPCPGRGADFREGDVADEPVFEYGDEGQGQRVCLAERIDDARLRTVAER